MGSVNTPNYRVDPTVKIYDRFYTYEADVPGDEYDVIYSYFKTVFGTATAAANFTVSLFRVAQFSDIPVMTLFQQMQGQSAPEITLTMAYYLNSISSPSTMTGLNAPVTPNYYVARNVRA
jgi:hypothetical protein